MIPEYTHLNPMPTPSRPARRPDPLARSITFRFPIELRDELLAMATNENRSMNACTIMLLRQSLDIRSKAAAKEAALLKEARRLAREAKKAAKAAAAA
jgi:hypothetical protein